jgi:predicted nucleic acid-binding protein
MSEKFLIDTSVFVEGEIDPRVLVDWLARQDDVTTSEVVLAEFSVGIHAPSDLATRERARKFFTDYILPVPALPVLSQEFREVGRLIGDAIRHGKSRPSLGDGLIAMCALREDRTVATINIKDFAAMGVETVNPLK